MEGSEVQWELFIKTLENIRKYFLILMKSERKRDMKQNEKKRKRVFALLTLCVLIISMSGNVFAAEPVDEEMPYFIINGEVIVNYGVV